MRNRSLSVATAAVVAFVLAGVQGVRAAETSRQDIEAIVRDYLAEHPDELGAIVKSYLMKNPEVLRDVLVEMAKRRSPPEAGGAAATDAGNAVAHGNPAIAGNAALLFGSSHQVTLGNPKGDVTLVEFFDYNCGFCKRALPDTLALLAQDPKLKVVLKELPILGPGSVEAARVAVAVRMQDPDGKKYLAFHKELLGRPGPAGRDKALAIASEQGFDMTRLEGDMASDEVSATFDEDAKLARAAGVTGTPSYVIGDSLVIGAVGIMSLRNKIEAERGSRPD